MKPLKTSESFEFIWPLRKELLNSWMLLIRLQKKIENLLFLKNVIA